MKSFGFFLFGSLFGIVTTVVGIFVYENLQNNLSLVSPLVMFDKQPKELPLQKYSINQLDQFKFPESNLQIIEKISENEDYSSFIFSFMTHGGSMSGKLNWPKKQSLGGVVVMIRGYVPPESFRSGLGTQAAAEVFVKEGFVTLAPDFLGFGKSSPDYTDTWEGRFVKPVQVMNLIKLIEGSDLSFIVCQYEAKDSKQNCIKKPVKNKIGIWAHSNGGQIALAMLEGFVSNYPTTLWAPVTAPFPYSVLFFSDEAEDEGKASRSWVSIFERDYDVFNFSLTKNLDRLAGPLQIHHGTADEAALFSWSLEFAQKIDEENAKRETLLTANEVATDGAEVSVLKPIVYELFEYQGADHNLRPSWSTVVARDVVFFKKYLGEN